MGSGSATLNASYMWSKHLTKRKERVITFVYHVTNTLQTCSGNTVCKKVSKGRQGFKVIGKYQYSRSSIQVSLVWITKAFNLEWLLNL